MNEAPRVIMAGLAGAALGGVFFGGLWWTVRRALTAAHPARWLLASGVLRMGAVVAGLYLAGGGRWPRLAAALVGLIAARIAVTRLTRPPRQGRPPAPGNTRHAH